MHPKPALVLIYLSIIHIYIYTISRSFGLIRNLQRSQTRKVSVPLATRLFCWPIRRIASAYGRDSPIKIHGCWWLNLLTPRISDGDSHQWWSIRKTIWLSSKMMIFCRVNHGNPTFIMVGHGGTCQGSPGFAIQAAWTARWAPDWSPSEFLRSASSIPSAVGETWRFYWNLMVI